MFALIEHGTDVVYEAVNSGNFSDFTSAMIGFGCVETFKKLVEILKEKRAHHNQQQGSNSD